MASLNVLESNYGNRGTVSDASERRGREGDRGFLLGGIERGGYSGGIVHGRSSVIHLTHRSMPLRPEQERFGIAVRVPFLATRVFVVVVVVAIFFPFFLRFISEPKPPEQTCPTPHPFRCYIDFWRKAVAR